MAECQGRRLRPVVGCRSATPALRRARHAQHAVRVPSRSSFACATWPHYSWLKSAEIGKPWAAANLKAQSYHGLGFVIVVKKEASFLECVFTVLKFLERDNC